MSQAIFEPGSISMPAPGRTYSASFPTAHSLKRPGVISADGASGSNCSKSELA